MDRQQVFIGQIPQDTDLLLSNKNAYIGLAKLAAALLGTNTLLNAFTCVPTSPASMSVNVTPGEIYSLQNIDNTAYGSLAADTSHSIVKQGISLNNTTLALTAPGTSGNSWNILIEVGFSETDGGSTVLPYYNASSPSSPWSGPNNTGQSNNTIRFNGVTIQAKTGVQAPTGTQVTPSPDTGFVGAFVVTVANGQSTITSGNISTYTGAPFITETLTQKISQATADGRYTQITAVQSGQYIYGVDTSGVANTVTATLSPAITSYTAGLGVRIKIANTNTGASTINLNGIGAANIKFTNGGTIGAGDLPAGGVADLFYDGTNFQLKNPGTADFSASSIQDESYHYAASTSSANTYTATLTPAPTAYVTGMRVSIKFSNPNTGAATLNLNSLGAINITSNTGDALYAGDIYPGMIADLRYDGTNFQLMEKSVLQFQAENLIFAGDFSDNPFGRGTSFTSPLNGVYIADRFCWRMVGSGAISSSQSTNVPTVSQCGMLLNNSLQVQVSTAESSLASTDYYTIRYCIEGYDFRKIAQRPFILSFWVKSSVTGTYCVSFRDSGTDQCFIGQYTIAAANTWQFVSIPVLASPSAGTWNYTNGAGLRIDWCLAAGTGSQVANAGTWIASNGLCTSSQVNLMATNGNTFNLAMVQLTGGQKVLPFLARSKPETIRLCKRYYEKNYPEGINPGTASSAGAVGFDSGTPTTAPIYSSARFEVEKAVAPTITIYDFTGAAGMVYRNTNGKAGVVLNINTSGFEFGSTDTSSSSYMFAMFTADAEIGG